MTWSHVVGTRLKRSVKAAKWKQKLLFQPMRLIIELNTKSKLKASIFDSYILLIIRISTLSTVSTSRVLIVLIVLIVLTL